MSYTEIQERGKSKYYYRSLSKREGNKISKIRRYLGKNLTNEELKRLEEEMDIGLGKPLQKVLSKKEIDSLETIKKNHKQSCKSNFDIKYEAFISRFTYDSNAIEGSTLTLKETAAILFDNITPAGKSPREINEAINHKKAFDFLINYDEDINKEFICQIQNIIVTNTLKKELESFTGIYRPLQVYIRGASFTPPKPEEVKKEMAALIRWYDKNKKRLHPVIIAAYFHCAFESIHPFVDGNGRTGRLLIDFMLHKNDFPMINIPVKRRLEYYDALETGRNGNLKKMINLIISLMSTEETSI